MIQKQIQKYENFKYNHNYKYNHNHSDSQQYECYIIGNQSVEY